MSDYGSTFDAPGDLTPSMRLLSSDADKVVGLLQSWGRLLNMQIGALWFDPNAGLTLRDFVADDEDPAVAASQINQALMYDERCARAITDIAVGKDGSWAVSVKGFAKDGRVYDLVFLATADKVSLLTAQQGS